MRRAFVAALLCLLLGAALAAALLERPQALVSLTDQVAAALPVSGVEHPVTAVLLNFRSYDTLLEIAVLVVAAVVGVALGFAGDTPTTVSELRNPLLTRLLQWLVPLMLMVAGYLLWVGSYRPGGAFQGGAVLAATGVLLRLADVALPGGRLLLRLGLVLGFAVFLAVAVAVMVGGGSFLAYPEAYAGSLILLIETALTVSIGLILLSLFAAAPSSPSPEPHRERAP